MDVKELINELKRVRKLYSNRDLAHMEAIQVLKNLSDLYGLSLITENNFELKNHI